jgi:hypothetical protein
VTELKSGRSYEHFSGVLVAFQIVSVKIETYRIGACVWRLLNPKNNRLLRYGKLVQHRIVQSQDHDRMCALEVP